MVFLQWLRRAQLPVAIVPGIGSLQAGSHTHVARRMLRTHNAPCWPMVGVILMNWHEFKYILTMRCQSVTPMMLAPVNGQSSHLLTGAKGIGVTV